MAHDPGRLVPGLHLHPAGRQSLRQSRNDSQYASGLAADRILARGKLEFYSMGKCHFPAHVHREDGTETSTRRLSPNRPSLYDDGHPTDLAELCSDGSGADENLFSAPVPLSRS